MAPTPSPVMVKVNFCNTPDWSMKNCFEWPAGKELFEVMGLTVESV
jgi:hypothetical protein